MYLGVKSHSYEKCLEMVFSTKSKFLLTINNRKLQTLSFKTTGIIKKNFYQRAAVKRQDFKNHKYRVELINCKGRDNRTVSSI